MEREHKMSAKFTLRLFPFQQKIIMDPLAYDEIRSRPSLEERLESIISGAALMADSSCTRDDRRERIVQECNAVRQALQDLLTEYEKNVSALSHCRFCPSSVCFFAVPWFCEGFCVEQKSRYI